MAPNRTDDPVNPLARSYLASTLSLAGQFAEAQLEFPRIVELSPSTRWVSVAYGEKVTFNTVGANGTQRSFAWQFDVSPVRSFVDLDDVAPADFPARSVRVFVAEAPEYRGG